MAPLAPSLPTTADADLAPAAPGWAELPMARQAVPVARQPQTPPAGVPLRTPMHPGRFLERQFLEPLGITQTRAAVLLGVSRRRVNELVMGHRAMSPDTALRCAMAFGTSATFWLEMQAHWDCYHAWRQMRAPAATAAPAEPAL